MVRASSYETIIGKGRGGAAEGIWESVAGITAGELAVGGSLQT